jgi:uroporphyrin-III C-methyltransferase
MGKVYLIGAGPGAADLITVRGAKLLGLAGIVFHDALVQPEMLDMAPQARKVAVGKRCSRLSTDQRFINRALVEAASRHDVVVRLKGGDPMLFGRAQEEIDALQAAGVAFEVVPGITAALAASAQLGVSLTRRGVSRSVVFATARIGEGEDVSDWAPAVAHADSAALYMGMGQAAQIAAVLEAHGMPASTPAMIVEGASLPGSREVATTLGDLQQAPGGAFAGPALLLFGEVYRDRLRQAQPAEAAAPAALKASGL